MLSDGTTVKQESYIMNPVGEYKARRVDKVARKLFPTSFIIFNVVYWSTYLLWKPVT